MHPGLWHELWVVFSIVAAGIIFGRIIDAPFLTVAIGLGLYLLNRVRHLRALHRWLTDNKSPVEIPDAPGYLGDLFAAIRKRVKQAESREDRLTGIIERFQRATAALPDAIVILSHQNEIEWANRAAARLIGVNVPRDTGMRLHNLLRDPDFAAHVEKGCYSEPIEIASPKQSDETISAQIVPFGENQKMLVFRDVTRIARLEETRRHFVSNASHELRTPLTVLLGYLETLRDMTPAANLAKPLAAMHEQATRMHRLVEDLLTLSRLETAPPRTRDDVVDVPALLASLKDQAEIVSGPERHRITLVADNGLRILGNRDELVSAFTNIVNNAVRYTPNGGTIALRWFGDTDGAKFEVSDNGEGIPAEHIPHLTERFYRVDSARSRASGGTGLGLSIVKHALVRHDAELRIESELGRGSTFTCVFPIARISPRLPAADGTLHETVTKLFRIS